MKKIYVFLVISMMTLSYSATCQEKKQKTKKEKTEKIVPTAFRINQRVIVTLSNGEEVEAVIRSRVSQNKYWVRQVNSGRQGEVKSKFIRPLNENDTQPKN